VSFLELVRRRDSVRRYLDKPVEREKVELCLEAARLAPSTSNSQPWRFIVVDEPELKSRVAAAAVGPLRTFNTFTDQAPVLVAVIIDRANWEVRTGKVLRRFNYSLIDIGIATEHFCLQAADLGLGTCVLGWFDEKAVKRLLRVPRDRRIYLLVALGYPREDRARVKRRKTIDQIRAYNRYG
jgi:nitroreductase